MANARLDPLEISSNYFSAKRRLLIIDYDGTLVPQQFQSGLTIPGKEIKSVARMLSLDPLNTFILIAGRSKEHLDLHWSGQNIILVAERGAFHRLPGEEWKTFYKINNDWVAPVASALNALHFEYPGSFVERRQCSIVWYFGSTVNAISGQEVGRVRSAIEGLPQFGLFITQTSPFSIELTSPGVNPGTFLGHWLEGKRPEFILAMGGSILGNSLFPTLGEGAITISVGPAGNTKSSYSIDDHEDALTLLRGLASLSPGGKAWNVS